MNGLTALARKWRDEADALQRDYGRVAEMQVAAGRSALLLCAEELEEAIVKAEAPSGGALSRNVSIEG